MQIDENDFGLALKLFDGQVKPRLRMMLCEYHFWVALFAAGLLSISLPSLPAAELAVHEVASAGLTFASISLGACIATCILAVALPGEARLRKWASTQGEIQSSSQYSDLVYVIVWAAIMQFSLILTCVVALIVGGERQVFPQGAPRYQYLSVWVAMTIFLYSAIELLEVLKTLMKVSVVITFEINSSNGDPQGT